MNWNVRLWAIGVVVLAGCRSTVPPVAVVPLRPGEPPPAHTDSPALPVAAAVSAPGPSQASADGVYRAPRIGKVFLRAHVDADGRLFGPQVVYQVVEPGGWNLDALEPADPEPRKAAKATPPVFEADAGWLIGSDEAVASTGSSRPSSGTAPKKDP